MKLIIFRKNGRDFEKVGLDVIDFSDRSLLIRHKGEKISMAWDSEYTFSQLLMDDILPIYIEGEDYTKAEVMPLLRSPKIKDLDLAILYRSELDKIKQESKKVNDATMQILYETHRFYTGKRKEDLEFVKEIALVGSESDDKFRQIERLLSQWKEKEKEKS